MRAEGVAKTGLKKLGKNLSKEAVARAAREIKTLATGRAELITRLNSMLLDDGLGEATKNALRRTRNSVQDHLHPSDLSGALRDKHGLIVRKSGSGDGWNHLEEVESALNSLANAKDNLLRELNKLEPGSEVYGRISRDMEAISELSRRTQGFLEIK